MRPVISTAHRIVDGPVRAKPPKREGWGEKVSHRRLIGYLAPQLGIAEPIAEYVEPPEVHEKPLRNAMVRVNRLMVTLEGKGGLTSNALED